MTTELFKIKQGGFNEIRKTMLIKTIPIALLAAFGGLAISYFNINTQPSEINVYPFVIPMILGVMAFGLYRGVNRAKKLFDSYRLTLDDNGITREQHNTPTIFISYPDVHAIIKNSSGSFIIKGNSSDVIIVPKQIDNYEKLEMLLSSLRPVSTKTNESLIQKYRSLLTVITIGLFAAVYISKNKVIVGVGGTILLVFLGYSFFEIQRSKNVDRKTKKIRWWLILVIASIAAVIYFKLFTTIPERDSLFESGITKYNKEDYSGAIVDFEKAIELDPSFVKAYYKVGYTYSVMHQYGKSIEFCSKAIEINKKYAPAYAERAYSKSSIGDFEGAIEDCTNAILINKNDAVSYANRAHAKSALKNFEGAIEDCNSALKIKPNYSTALVNRGFAKDALERWDEAIIDYEKAISIAPNEEVAYNNIGHTLNSKLKFIEAKKYLDKAIELSNNYKDAYYNRGVANWGLNDSIAACNDWNQAYELGDSGALNKIKAHCK